MVAWNTSSHHSGFILAAPHCNAYAATRPPARPPLRAHCLCDFSCGGVPMPRRVSSAQAAHRGVTPASAPLDPIRARVRIGARACVGGRAGGRTRGWEGKAKAASGQCVCDVTRQRDGSMGLRRTKPTNGWLAGACCAIVAGLQCTMRRSMWLRMSAFSFESILTCASRYAFSRTCRIGSATLHGV